MILSFKVKTREAISLVSKLLVLLPSGDTKKLPLLIFAQISLALFDIIGVALFSAVAGLVVSNGAFAVAGSRLHEFLKFFKLDSLDLRSQVIILGSISLIILILKSFFSFVVSKKIVSFYAKRSALVSSKLLSDLLSGTLSKVQSKSLQEHINGLTEGVQTIYIRGLSSATIILTDTILLICFFALLCAIDAVMAFVVTLFFSSIAIVQLKVNTNPARRLGRNWTQLSIQANEYIEDITQNYRDFYVRNTLEKLVREFSLVKARAMDTYALRVSQSFLTKYIMEISLVIGIFLMSVFQFMTKSDQRAFLTLSVFLASSLRITPALLRIQQEILTLRSSLASASATRSEIEKFVSSSGSLDIETWEKPDEIYHEKFEPTIEISNARFTYSGQKHFKIDDLNFSVLAGKFVALVGPSGSGKSTLMDLMLGVLDSESGSITLSGKRPRDAIRAWPGKIAYIPQHIGIKNGSIRDNVLFGLSHEVYGDREIEKALHIAAFEEVFEWDKKLDSVIGPGGIRLSGGQQQRLGIARALVTEPDLVFMDEATSSLDSSAEAKFLENWNQIRKGRTVVVIAHRLSTVKAAEQVAYLDHGKLVYVGSFEQVREAIPQFERQARLLGIS